MTINQQLKVPMHAVTSSADSGASSVALRAPCDAPGSAEHVTACISALGCWLIVIPTSLLTDLSGVGAAGHIGTGGCPISSERSGRDPSEPRSAACSDASRETAEVSRGHSSGSVLHESGRPRRAEHVKQSGAMGDSILDASSPTGPVEFGVGSCCRLCAHSVRSP